MANTLNLGTDGNWGTKDGSLLGYNNENNNYKPLPFDFTRASSATRVNKQGLIETVASGVPRIDFTDANGALLLEPQRTNFVSQSEYFGDSSWDNSNAVTRSISSISSPEGKLNAYDIIPTTANTNHTLRAPNLSGFTSGAVVNVSFFAKANGYKFISVVGGFGSSSTPSVVFNLESGTIVSGTGTMEDYGDGWWRCVAPITLNATALYCVGTILNDSQSGSFAGDGTSAISVYGYQAEQGSYATSYIPTQGSAVTRIADVCSQTVPSGIIGQTEGTIYWNGDLNNLANYSNLISLSGSAGSWIYAISYSAGLSFEIKSNYSTSLSFNPSTYTVGSYKIAISYSASECVIYINGVLVHTDSSVVIPSFSTLNIGQWSGYGETKNTKEVKLYNTRLSNAELATLTTI